MEQAVSDDAPVTLVQPKSKPAGTNPQRLPPYAVIVLNDDLHSFPYVIETFGKVFGYSAQKSFLLATQIHTQGQAIVWSGAKEVAELKRDQIRGAGPDMFSSQPIDFPLGVTIEPLP